jgi:hypothetical protein
MRAAAMSSSTIVPCELNGLDAGELTVIVHAPDHSLDRRALIEDDSQMP